MKDPVAAFHALLENERLAADSVQALSEGQRERRLMFGERPLCVAMRPQLLTSRRYEQAVAAAEGVASALAALEKAVLQDADLRRELGLEEHEFCFLCIGFLQHHKGFDRAVQAFARIPGSHLRLDVVGSVRMPAPDK